jgi:hypothetical protein
LREVGIKELLGLQLRVSERLVRWGEKDLKRTICLMLYEKKWYDKFCK